MTSKKKQIVRLTESDLHRIVRNSVKKVLKEDFVVSQGYPEELAYKSKELAKLAAECFELAYYASDDPKYSEILRNKVDYFKKIAVMADAVSDTCYAAEGDGDNY